MKTLKIGIVGFGRMGQEHLRIISDYSSHTKVKAVCDIEFNQDSKNLTKRYKKKEKEKGAQV